MAKRKKIEILDDEQQKKVTDQMLRRVQSTLLIPLDKIHPNTWNKNKMSKDYFKALKQNISNPQIGFTIPILVEPHPDYEGEYRIIDGEHRYKACTQLGLEKIPAVNIQDLPEAVAKYLTLESNKIRGVTSDEDYKKELESIEEDPLWKELMSEDFDAFDALMVDRLNEEADKYTLDDDSKNDLTVESATAMITLYFSPQQLEIYKRITSQLRMINGITAETAVIQCISHFEETTGFGVNTGDSNLDATL
jgi:ParB/RepB/Spo0J family partition protein